MEGSFNKINKFIFICKKWKLNFIKSMIWIIQPQGGGGGGAGGGGGVLSFFLHT